MDTIRKAAGLKTFPLYDRYLTIYVCARFGRQTEAKELSLQLQRMGYTITSSWVDQVVPEMFRESDQGPGEAAYAAQKDLDEVAQANSLVYLSEVEENQWGRGGRHVEFGYAIALGKIVWVVGPLENLFHYLPNILQFTSTDDFLEYLEEETT